MKQHNVFNHFIIMKMLIVYLLLISIISSPTYESSLKNIYLRRISDAFIKLASNFEQSLALSCEDTTECLKTQHCLKGLCRNPCPGSCGVDATCHVLNHTLSCSCPECYKGDPHKECTPLQGFRHFMCQLGRFINNLGGT